MAVALGHEEVTGEFDKEGLTLMTAGETTYINRFLQGVLLLEEKNRIIRENVISMENGTNRKKEK